MQTIRIGINGTGFIARGFVMALRAQPDFVLSKVLTRRPTSACVDFPKPELLTNDPEVLIRESDVIVECCGDVVHATNIVDMAMQAGLPVITMDAEFHVTTGSYFANKGYLTEAEGDQPGCLAALHEEAVQMGFKPLVYGNIKRFLNHQPTPEEMQFWSQKQGIRQRQTVAFTDGTKLQIEQALVANGLGAGIAVSGLLGVQSDDVETGARMLADGAKQLGHPISDYILSPHSPAGVFIAATHGDEQQDYLRYLKLGDGPYYVLLRNYHLCHLEIVKTIRRVMTGGPVLLNNSALPRISVAAVAKRRLVPGERIVRGIGSFDLRGVALRITEQPHHVPIGLINGAVVQKPIEPGQTLLDSDVAIPDSLAVKAWDAVRARVLGPVLQPQRTDRESVRRNRMDIEPMPFEMEA